VTSQTTYSKEGSGCPEALQAKVQADSSRLEVALLKQFAARKDDVLLAMEGKYATLALAAEAHGGLRCRQANAE
jgi:hypothetical protein